MCLVTTFTIKLPESYYFQEEGKRQQIELQEAEEKERTEWLQVCLVSYIIASCCNDYALNLCGMQSLEKVKSTSVKSKFDGHSSDPGVKIAFKLPDGTKTEYTFPCYSTVKVRLQ